MRPSLVNLRPLAVLTLLLLGVGVAWGGTAPSPNRLRGAPSTRVVPSALQVPDTFPHRDLRHSMVREQLAARDIYDEDVLEVMRRVPRHRFVPGATAEMAYRDSPLPIGHGQTISQPYIVAFMAQAADLEPTDRVLEIGTGSGYGAAVLSGLAGEIYTVEIVSALAQRARRVLGELGFENVHVRHGNGWLGWSEHAPYDAIVVTAAPDEVPRTLVDQLVLGGTLVVPVGEIFQELRILRKTEDGLVEEESLPVRFVPMVEKPDTTG